MAIAAAMSSSRGEVRAAAWLIVVAITGWALAIGREILVPLAVAVLTWQLVNAIAAQFRRLAPGGRRLGTAASLALALATIAVGLGFAVGIILDHVGAVTLSAAGYEANLFRLIAEAGEVLGVGTPATLRELTSHIELDSWMRGLAAALASFVGSAGLVALYVVFMLLEQHSFEPKIEALSRDPLRAAAARTLLRDLGRRIERYVWIKTVIGLTTAFLSWLVLVLVDCSHASFWALVIFLASFIPVIGAWVGAILPSLLVLVQHGSVAPFLVSLAALTAIQVGFSSILEPRLMGRSLNLSPVVIVLSLALWGSLWGVAGMFLCVPITVILLIICSRFEATRPVAILLSADGRLDKP